MEIFTTIFLVIIGLFFSFSIWIAYDTKYRGNPKAFLKRLGIYILYVLGMLLAILVIIILFAIVYGLTKNLIVAGIITVVISLIVIKILERF